MLSKDYKNKQTPQNSEEVKTVLAEGTYQLKHMAGAMCCDDKLGFLESIL